MEEEAEEEARAGYGPDFEIYEGVEVGIGVEVGVEGVTATELPFKLEEVLRAGGGNDDDDDADEAAVDRVADGRGGGVIMLPIAECRPLFTPVAVLLVLVGIVTVALLGDDDEEEREGEEEEEEEGEEEEAEGRGGGIELFE